MPRTVLSSAVALFFSLISFSISAQNAELRVSENYRAVIKEIPYVKICQAHGETNYFVYGAMHFYDGVFAGSIIKVDSNGKRIDSFANVATDNQILKAIALPSGEVLVLGNFRYINGQPAATIARLKSDGALDASFSNTYLGNVRDMVLQSDGRIIISTANQLIGLNADGSHDDDFSGFFSSEGISPAVLDNEDNIYFRSGNVLKRLDPDGVEQQTYNTDTDAFFNDTMIPDAEGRLIASLMRYPQDPPYIANYEISRFLPDGTRDDSFTAAPTDQAFTNLAIGPDGNIFITGLFVSFDGHAGNVFELNDQGDYLNTVVTTDANYTESFMFDSDGNIFITGSFSRVNATPRPYAAKLRPDYSLDETFTLPVTRVYNSSWISSAVDVNGKLVAGGLYGLRGAGAANLPLFRLNRDGSLDTSFEPKLNTDDGNGTSMLVRGIITQEDKVVIAGIRLTKDAPLSLLRLMPNGDIDNTFKSQPGPDNSFGIMGIRAFENKIYVYGNFYSFHGNPVNGFAILDSDGNFLGPVNPSVSYFGSYYQDMEVQSDGKLIVMGNFLVPADGRTFIRINTDGSLDETFGVQAGNVFDFTVDSEDRIIVVENSTSLLKRFDKNGVPDPTLELGSGFTRLQWQEVIGYSVKADAENNLMVGGLFNAYRGNPANGIAILNEHGDFLFGDDVHDANAYPVNLAYDHRRLFAIGNFPRGNGAEISSATQIVFPINNVITNLTTDAMTDATMDLSWENSFEGADKVVLEKSLSPDGPFEFVTEITSLQHAYQVTGLEESTRYAFRLSAENEFYSEMEGPVSDTTAVRPVEALPATDITINSFVANWTMIPKTDSVELHISSDNFTTVESRITEQPSLEVTDLPERKSYQYRVRRFRNGLASLYSEPVTATLITSLEEQYHTAIQIRPNPASAYVTVTLPANTIQGSAQLTTIEGKVVDEFDFSSHEFNVNLINIPPGLMLLRLKTKHGIFTSKILKVN